jgi:CRP-like cAMP-binding protein
MAKFVSMFTKERSSGREQMPLEWTFEMDSAGVVRVDYKQAHPLAVFRSWVEFGLSNATAIAEAMDVSVGHVSKLARRAVGAGWLRVQGRKYILVSGAPV